MTMTWMQFRKKKLLAWGQSQVQVLQRCHAGVRDMPEVGTSVEEMTPGDIYGAFFLIVDLMWEGLAHCGQGHS